MSSSAQAPFAEAEHPILFQKFFKSPGPRTYAAQVKKATNGNHYLVLTEGKREKDSAEVRKTRVFVFSEDFIQFFAMLKDTAEWIRANPMPQEVRDKRKQFWDKQSKSPVAPPMNRGGNSGARTAAPPRRALVKG